MNTSRSNIRHVINLWETQIMGFKKNIHTNEEQRKIKEMDNLILELRIAVAKYSNRIDEINSNLITIRNTIKETLDD